MKRRYVSPFQVTVARDGMVRAQMPKFDAAAIERHRRRKRWTQAQLARRINAAKNRTGRVTADDVDLWETGSDVPCCNTGSVLVDLFGMSEFEDLFRMVTVTFHPSWIRAARERCGFSLRETAKLSRLREKDLRALERGAVDEVRCAHVGSAYLRVLDAIGEHPPHVREQFGARARRPAKAKKSGRVLRLVGKADAASKVVAS